LAAGKKSLGTASGEQRHKKVGRFPKKSIMEGSESSEETFKLGGGVLGDRKARKDYRGRVPL